MFDHLVRKIVALANAFTGLETMQTVLPHQVNMLLEHQWPGASAGISKAAAKANMIKKMLGRGKKKSDTWESPFGSHFPNPQKKANYKFYHATYCPETGAYQDEIFSSEIDEDTEERVWRQYHMLERRGFIYYIKGNIRIQITTDEKIFFYLIDKETFAPILENVMMNYMACN